MSDAYRVQKRVSDPLEIQMALQVAVVCPVGAGVGVYISCKSSQCSEALCILSSSVCCHLYYHFQYLALKGCLAHSILYWLFKCPN